MYRSLFHGNYFSSRRSLALSSLATMSSGSPIFKHSTTTIGAVSSLASPVNFPVSTLPTSSPEKSPSIVKPPNNLLHSVTSISRRTFSTHTLSPVIENSISSPAVVSLLSPLANSLPIAVQNSVSRRAFSSLPTMKAFSSLATSPSCSPIFKYSTMTIGAVSTLASPVNFPVSTLPTSSTSSPIIKSSPEKSPLIFKPPINLLYSVTSISHCTFSTHTLSPVIENSISSPAVVSLLSPLANSLPIAVQNSVSRRAFSSLPTMKAFSSLATSPSCSPIFKYSTTTIGAVSTLASPVNFPVSTLPTSSTSSPIIKSSPEKSPLIVKPPINLLHSVTSISHCTFSTHTLSPVIENSSSSPAVVRLLSPLANSLPIAVQHSVFRRAFSSLPDYSLLLSRSYGGFPKMRGSLPKRPHDAMDTSTLNANFVPAEEFTDVTPEGAVVEIKLATCSNLDPRRPSFKVHNLRSGFEDGKGNVAHLICNPPKAEADDNEKKFYEFMIEIAKEMMKLDLDMHGISDAKLAQLWWPERGEVKRFWAYSLLKHFRFSSQDAITDYASKTFNLANPIINGTENQPGLGEFLEMKGFTTGKYHDVCDLMPALKEYFTVDAYPTFVGLPDPAYPTFVGHGAYHPALSEVGVLTNKDCGSYIEHPMSTTVPQGKFLMRRL